MKQPKFKFGDIVYRKAPNQRIEPFQIGLIEYANEIFWYGHNLNTGVHASEIGLELFEEPKPKKLYAYRNDDGAVRFLVEDIDEGFETETVADVFSRCPEFDLTYPEVPK